MIREYSAKNQVENTGKQKISNVELKILGKQKTCLKDL
jgi:hypothetical protein